MSEKVTKPFHSKSNWFYAQIGLTHSLDRARYKQHIEQLLQL